MNRMIASLAAICATVLTVAPAPAGDLQTAQAPASQGSALGMVNTVDAGKGVLNMTHGPIPSLGWPEMTMDFGVAPGVPLAGLAKGSKISFTVAKGNDGVFRIIAISPAAK